MSKQQNIKWGNWMIVPMVVIVAGFVWGGRATAGRSARVHESESAIQMTPKSGYDINYLRGLFDPATHPDFVKVAARYTERTDFYMHRQAYEAFEKMHAAAMKEGIQLSIVSATRNFYRQKQIWEAKWRGERLLEGGESAPMAYPDPVQRALAILRYSSMPGTSRHHWGTDIDLVALENAFFEAGEGKKIYDWLTNNASAYGYCQPYSPKGEERPTGYEEEKWHWSYLPLSTMLTQLAKDQLRNEDISGFEGAEAAMAIDVVGRYVLGIHADCTL